MKYPPITQPGSVTSPGNAAILFDSVVLGPPDAPALANQFQIVALPGQYPAMTLQAGDLVISRALGEGSIASASRVESDQEYEPEGRSLGYAAGRYFECAHESGAASVLRVFDESGRLPFDRLVLRPIELASRSSENVAAEGVASLGEIIPVPIDTAIVWDNGKAFFFKGDEYVRYDIATDKADAGYPRKIDPAWPGLKWRDIDASMRGDNGKAYFFKGDQYLRYDVKADKADAGYPKKIAGNWPGLAWSRDIDAAVQWTNGKVYFFKGDEYVRYTLKTLKADAGYPKKIAAGWPGITWRDLDAVIVWNSDKAYFFKGDEYIRYDIKADRADAGYPAKIGEYWKGLVACACTPGRKYAYATKTLTDVVGVKSKIETRYGKVCCEGQSTVNAYHVAYANVSKNGGTTIWAQSGWGRERNPGASTTSKYRYAEMQGTAYQVEYDTANAPAEGSVHEYRCDLNSGTGKWTYRFDGTAWKTYADAGWKTKGNTALWVGEIRNQEDDMPGTDADRCEFSVCQYCLSGGSYTDAGLTAADMRTDDPAEWGANRLSNTSFEIWDKKPI